MFGYIKPDKENLLVKDLTLYKATYCGLCSVIKKNISPILPLFLSYDFVFLSMVRCAITAKKSCVTKGHCKYNPLKKCAYSICDSETLYTAETALILTTLKLEDDILDRDKGFFKSIGIRLFHHHLNSKMKKLTKNKIKYNSLILAIRQNLKKLSELEKSQSDELDRMCEIFGSIMSDITSFEVDEKEKPISKEIGSAVGRYIYLVDAIDDLDKDVKSRSYNPLLKRYGSQKEVLDNMQELDIAVSMYAQRAILAAELLKECEYTRIIKNILSRGLGAESYKIMTRNGENND